MKLYLLSIIVFWLGLEILEKFAKHQLKKDNLILQKKSLTKRVEMWAQTIICSLIPAFNVIFIIFAFTHFESVYTSMKKDAIPKDGHIKKTCDNCSRFIYDETNKYPVYGWCIDINNYIDDNVSCEKWEEKK